MAKKKNNYLFVDTNNIKFTENSESEDIDVEEYDDDDDVDDSNIDKDDLSNSDDNDDDDDDEDVSEEDDNDDNEDENINNNLDEKNKKDNKDDYVKISWEKDKKNYYQYESENSSSDDDEEENKERLKEAIYLNKKEKENLEEDDFDLYNIYTNENKDNQNVKENIIKKIINDMNNELKEKKEEITLENKDKQEEIKQLVMSEQQEYLILLKELSLNIEKVFNEIKENQKLFEFKDINEKNVPSSDINKNTLLYLKKKNETMLTYIIYITYYVFLKVMNSYTPTHPVLDKLIYMNTIISKTNELDNKIKFKIQQLNKSADKTFKKLNGMNGGELQEETQEDKYEDDEEERDINDNYEEYDDKDDDKDDDEEEEDDDEEDDDEEDDDEEDDDEEDDNDEEEDDDDEEEDDDGDDEEEEEDEEEGYNEQKKDLKNKKYKISKSLITEYTDSHIREKEKEEKKKKREKMKNEKNIFVKEIKDMISSRPEKIEEENYLKKMEEKYMDFDEKILNKKMKELSKKKNKMRNLTNVGMTTNDLLKFVELPEMNQQNDQKNNKFDEKKIFRSNINKIKQIKKNKLEHNPNDDFVSYKKFDKNKQKTFNTNEYKDQQNNTYGKKKIHDEIDDEHIKNMLNFKDMKKEKRKKFLDERNKQIRKKLVDEENEEVDRRMPNQKIMQNKGLVRKRKSTDGNARVHNRFKYMKKMKVYNSQHAKLKVHDNNYSGEKRGINPYLKKSVDIK
ncbi:hypothetical protein PFBG_04893 [Plasmodium falciparum 7G8]|uniref:Sas10 C-terminal domain-containing protein n=1 Tax=Plasmodium falciparum (isolate 7G8) TaxID=57266 RepID=W7EVF9_PLAF8|nr:hypothetical protein PFBG_04893 [Plasmodium falciparum 7G8]